MTNERFTNALLQKSQRIPPVWFMRQAGRYHKHYQSLRAKHSFMELCTVPELAAQVALGPVLDFEFDVAILFSDILFPLHALGMGLSFDERGPHLEFPLTPDSISTLKPVSDATCHLEFQKDALRETRKVLPETTSLLGFVGGPFTLFGYAVDGSHRGNLPKTKAWLETLLPPFFKILIPLLKNNIALQFEGGAEIVMLFDTAAGELSPEIFSKYILPVLGELSQAFPNRLAYYSKGTKEGHFASDFYSLPWAGLGIDCERSLTAVLRDKPVKGFIQGNFDEKLLLLPTSDFKKALENYLQSLRGLDSRERAGWICGLGHGVLPTTPEEHVRYFVQRVREIFS